MALALQSLIGVISLPILVWLFSENRQALAMSKILLLVAGTLAAQLAIALLVLKVPTMKLAFDWISGGVLALQTATEQGAQLLFGYLAGGAAPFEVTAPENAYVLAFRFLPIILVLSALMRLLYYWGVLQAVVGALAAVLRRLGGIGGPLATVSAASIFLGLVEAPLTVRPYLSRMGRGTLFAMMCVAMATVAGTVLALYASVLSQAMPGAAGHLIAGSLMNVPGALMLAKLAVPDGYDDSAGDAAKITLENPPRGSMDAIVQGTIEGLQLVATVAALLIVIVSLVALTNATIAGLAGLAGLPPITLQQVFGFAMAPLAWLIGIPWSEAWQAGALLGQKLILNEFLAYIELAKLPADALSDRSRLLLTYALCGFANLGSLGILIGGLSAMAPDRRAEITALAPKAVAVGFVTTLLSAALVGTISF